MEKVTAYLAHPALSRKKIREWELKIEGKYNLDLINPFYDVGGIECELMKQYDAGVPYKDVPKPFGYEQYLVHRDINAILKSDFVIAFITGDVSYGTIMEICYATQLKKPVFLIVLNKEEEHPWLKYHSCQRFTSIKEFEIFLDMHSLINFTEMKWYGK